jgi:hypothetical protein
VNPVQYSSEQKVVGVCHTPVMEHVRDVVPPKPRLHEPVTVRPALVAVQVALLSLANGGHWICVQLPDDNVVAH